MKIPRNPGRQGYRRALKERFLIETQQRDFGSITGWVGRFEKWDSTVIGVSPERKLFQDYWEQIKSNIYPKSNWKTTSI